MAKDWKCRTGLHDWEVTDGVAVEVGIWEDQWYDQRVCLRCGLVDDQMTAFIESLDKVYRKKYLNKKSSYRTLLEKEHATERKKKAWRLVDGKNKSNSGAD